MSRVIYTSLAIVALFVSGCGRPNIGELLQSCNELKEKNDPKSWQQIRKNLDIVVKQIKTDDESLPIHNFYVMSLIRTGEWERAAEVADKLQAQFPEDFLANYQLGKIKVAQGADAEAYPYLQNAAQIEGEPSAKTLTLLLSAAEQCGAKDAEQYFTKAAEMPEFTIDPTFYNLWGLWLIRRGSDEQNKKYYYKAVDKLVKAAKLDNVSPKVFRNLAVLWDKHLGNPKVARQYYVRYKARLAMNPATNTRENHVPVQRRINEIK